MIVVLFLGFFGFEQLLFLILSLSGNRIDFYGDIFFAGLCIPSAGWLAWRTYAKFEAKPLARIIRTYILIAVAFAGLYNLIYHLRPSYFSFSSGVSQESELTKMAALSERISHGYRRVGMLSKLNQWLITTTDGELQALIDKKLDTSWQLPGGIEVKHFRGKGASYYLSLKDQIDTVSFGGITDTSEEANLVSRLVREQLRKDEYKAVVLELESLEKKTINSAADRLRYLRPIGAFSFLDFLYFSFVTVTTLGYGDIVPNSTLVRLLVVMQIIIGLLLILNVSNSVSSR